MEGTLMVNANSDFWVITNRVVLLHELFSSLLLPTSIKKLQYCWQATSHAFEEHAAYSEQSTKADSITQN